MKIASWKGSVFHSLFSRGDGLVWLVKNDNPAGTRSMLITTHFRRRFIKKYQEWNVYLRETNLKIFFEVLHNDCMTSQTQKWKKKSLKLLPRSKLYCLKAYFRMYSNIRPSISFLSEIYYYYGGGGRGVGAALNSRN